MALSNQELVLGAVDVGTNSIKLELARALPDGSLEKLHQERDPVRPGEGVFKSGYISREVSDRILSTLRRYGALCRRYGARVRAVATSAIREAKNKDEIIRRARREAGLNLEVVSGREEARLICLGILYGNSPRARSLCIDVGGGSTEVATAVGERPTNLWSISLGAVRLTELFDSSGEVSSQQLTLMREYAREAIGTRVPRSASGFGRNALGSSGTIKAAVSFASDDGTSSVSARRLAGAVRELVKMGPEGRRKFFEPRRADIILAGAVILEALAQHLGLETITTVDRGLRDGILVDLMRRRASRIDRSMIEGAEALGSRFQFDQAHGRQVARIAVTLFDELRKVHKVPTSARPFLEVAALLHDIGNAVSYNRHHRHTYYLISNADLPGLADREREMVACIARFHRRNLPDAGHPDLRNLTLPEAETVLKLSTLLRVADSLDRSHHQPVQEVTARATRNQVVIRLHARAHVDLELWDVEHEASTFEQVFGRKLICRLARQR